MAFKLLLLSFVALAAASDYRFIGSKLDFSEPNNWADKTVPLENAGVGIIDMSSDTPYSTFVDTGVYSAGRIILADDGRMIFSDDGEVRIVLDEDTLSAPITATFKGPREEEGFDFNCVKNWEVNKDASVIPESPPCSGDIVSLERDHSYFFFVGDEVPSVPLSGLSYDDGTVLSQSSLPTYTFSDDMTSILNIADQGTADCPYIQDGECYCLNSCPTPEQALVQNARLLSLLQQRAQQELKRSSDIETHPFEITGNFDWTDINSQQLGAKDVLNPYLATLTQSDTMVASASFNSGPSGASFTLTGTAVGPRGYLARPSDDVVDFLTSDGDWDTTLPPLGDDDQAPMHKFVYVAMYTAGVQTAATSGADCTGNTAFCQQASWIHSLFANPGTLLTGLCPVGSACASKTEIMNQLNSATASNLGQHLTMSTLNRLKSALADGMAGTTPDATLYNAIIPNSAAAAAVVNSVPAVSQGSGSVDLGALFPDIFRYRLADPMNADAVIESLGPMLMDLGSIISASNFALDFNVLSMRRDLAEPSTLTATFDFVKAGSATMSDDLMKEAARRLDLAVSARDVSVDKCYSLNTMSFDEDCLTADAVANVDADADQNAYVTYIQNRIKCDDRGQTPDGNCYGEREGASDTADRLGGAAFSQQQDLQSSGSKSGGGGGGNTGIIVGAAIAGIVAIAVVAFFVSRRNGGHSAAKQQDRSVVAFNNPLYDESGNVVDATYDNPADAEGDGGIYDEPAFNQGAEKNNPLYNSNDNLADTEGYMTTEGLPEGDHQDGYVDTDPDHFGGDDFGDDFGDEPEEGGYLDVGEEGDFGGFDGDDE